jgi:ribose transport system permease protein
MKMKKLISKIKFQDIVPFIAFLAIFVFFTIASKGNMLSSYNLRKILDQSMVPIVVGLGVLFAVAQGSIDLSVGVNLALSGVVAVYVSLHTGQAWLMIPVAMLVALGVGIVTGLIVSFCKVPSFMVTIALLIGVRGLVNFIQTRIGVEYIPESLQILNVPAVKISMFIAIVLIMAYVFEFTKAGRYSKAIGENETTARFVGIPITKMKLLAFAMAGLMAGVGAIFSVVTVGGTSNTMGSFLEMKVAMSVFLGGVLVTGGTSAKVYKVLLGSLSINIIDSGLALIGKSESQISEAVEGILLLLILFITILATRFDRRRVKESSE